MSKTFLTKHVVKVHARPEVLAIQVALPMMDDAEVALAASLRSVPHDHAVGYRFDHSAACVADVLFQWLEHEFRLGCRFYRSNSAAMMLMLPNTATTSLTVWPSISFGNVW